MNLRALTLGAAAAALLAAAGCAREDGAGPVLQVPLNALCTTCTDFIRCDEPTRPNEAVGQGAYQLLELRPKTMAAQMATIFDYLLQAFRERKEDRRPLLVHSPASRGASTMPADTEAVIDLQSNRIALPDGWIDQTSGAWHGADDDVKGQCTPLTLAEGRQALQRLQTTSAVWADLPAAQENAAP